MNPGVSGQRFSFPSLTNLCREIFFIYLFELKLSNLGTQKEIVKNKKKNKKKVKISKNFKSKFQSVKIINLYIKLFF